MASLKSYLSILSLNVNGLNAPIKRHRVAEWIKRNDPSICCLQETHFEPKDTFRLKVKGWGTIFHANGPQKKAGVANLISDTAKAVLRGKYIAIQASLKRIQKSKMHFLYSHLKKLELEQKNTPNPHTRRQLIKIRAEISKLETKSTVEQINKARSWFSERI